jgi:hypothetical protein
MIWTRVDQDASISGRDKAIARLLAGAAIMDSYFCSSGYSSQLVFGDHGRQGEASLAGPIPIRNLAVSNFIANPDQVSIAAEIPDRDRGELLNSIRCTGTPCALAKAISRQCWR